MALNTNGNRTLNTQQNSDELYPVFKAHRSKLEALILNHPNMKTSLLAWVTLVLVEKTQDVTDKNLVRQGLTLIGTNINQIPPFVPDEKILTVLFMGYPVELNPQASQRPDVKLMSELDDKTRNELIYVWEKLVHTRASNMSKVHDLAKVLTTATGLNFEILIAPEPQGLYPNIFGSGQPMYPQQGYPQQGYPQPMYPQAHPQPMNQPGFPPQAFQPYMNSQVQKPETRKTESDE